jgi:hypothetical protein
MGADKSLTHQEGNKLQRQKVLNFIYPIYNHNWRNISTIYIYIYTYKTILASNEIFSPSNKIHREVGRAKDLSAHLYILLLHIAYR